MTGWNYTEQHKCLRIRLYRRSLPAVVRSEIDATIYVVLYSSDPIAMFRLGDSEGKIFRMKITALIVDDEQAGSR